VESGVEFWIQIPVPSLIGFVNMSKLFNLSVPQFPRRKKRINSASLIELLSVSNELICVKYLKQCLAHSTLTC
jgi:hypothetical protein